MSASLDDYSGGIGKGASRDGEVIDDQRRPTLDRAMSSATSADSE
jgi:hypothetical protein